MSHSKEGMKELSMAMREFSLLSLTAAVFSRPIQFSSAALSFKREGSCHAKKKQHSAASEKKYSELKRSCVYIKFDDSQRTKGEEKRTV